MRFFWLICLLFLFNTAHAVVYEVLPKSSIRQVSRDLKSLGLIRCAFCFEWRLRWEAKPVLIGEYDFQTGLTTNQLIKKLTQGDVIHYPITFIEGWKISDTMKQMALSNKLEHTLQSPKDLAQFLGLTHQNPEGWLFPSTYDYTKGTSDRLLYQQSHQLMKTQLERIWAARDQNGALKTPYELLILASIIEKETARLDEMPLVSGVYHRRLKRGMRLQADPTVIYGLGESFQGRLRKKDLLKDTPYNTYTRRGLPPTPIALPSLAALEAAAHPSPGDTYYFVAKGDGTHYFSKNLKMHQNAVQQYQRRL